MKTVCFLEEKKEYSSTLFARQRFPERHHIQTLRIECDKLNGLTAECTNKIQSRFSPTFLSEVVLYLNNKNLKVNAKIITKELKIDVEEWWNDMLV